MEADDMKKLNDEIQEREESRRREVERLEDIVAKCIERIGELYSECQMWRGMYAVSRTETDDEDAPSLH